MKHSYEGLFAVECPISIMCSTEVSGAHACFECNMFVYVIYGVTKFGDESILGRSNCVESVETKLN